VVFKDPSGQEGSYFGYTVALQQDGWLLVGAPRGNSTHPNHLDVMEPGMLYQCRIEGDATCTSRLLDSAGNDRNEAEKYLQHKNNSWTGGSLDVIDDKNGNIAVCGSRWVNLFYAEDKERDFLTGICYLTDKSNSEKDAGKLLPLNKNSNFFYNRKPVDGDRVRSTAFYYAYGQFGMSVHFTREGEEMIIGAPGVMDWTGTVVRYKTSDRRIPVIPNPLRTPELKNYTYVGYSVSSGNFISGKNKTYYVSGAPRGGKEFQGKVYVFDFRNITPTGDEYKMQVIQELEGKQTGEYFGAAICVLDVNGDGLDDILVGAPHYGAAKTWDQGRIYVFLTKNVMEEITFVSTDPLSKRQSGAQFGAAVSSLGDINKDGYKDFVVGAPYEDSGTGAIYVYHGGNQGPSEEASQRIVGSEIGHDILGFGISFSRSFDIDGNNYTDIAVGAYKSGHAIVLKSRPIIKYEASITPDVSSIGYNATSFNIKACLTYRGKTVPPFVTTKVNLTLDGFYRRVRPSNITYVVTVSKSTPVCSNHFVVIEDFVFDFSKPIQLSMAYMLEDGPNDGIFCNSCPVVDPKKTSPVTSSLSYTTECRKEDSCTPNLSITAEFIDVVPPLIIGSQPTVRMKVTVQNSGEPAFLANVRILLPAACPLVRLPPSCEFVDNRDDEVARRPELKKELKCLVGNPLSKGKKETRQLELIVKDVASGTEGLDFSVNASSAGNELDSRDNVYNVTLSFVTQTDIGLSGFAERNEIFFSKGNETKETHMEFSHFYQVTNFGPSPVNKIDLEFKIPVSYAGVKNFIQFDVSQMSNDGKYISCVRSDTGLVRSIRSFNMSINSEETNTTEQLDFSDTISTEFSDTTDSGTIWKNKDTAESGNTSIFAETAEGSNASKSEDAYRKFRSGSTNNATDFPGSEPTQSTEGKVLIDCKNPETTCVTVNCSLYGPIGNMSRPYVSFSMSATIEDLESVQGSMRAIIFHTTGKVKITDPKNVQQTQKNSADEKDVATVLHGKINLPPFDFATLGWAVAGVLLSLIIIIIILWKFGFFVMKRPEELYRALIKKQEEE